MTTLESNLKATLNDMGQFISVEVGDTFTGIYKGFKKIPSRFEPEKEVVELYFDLDGKVKSLTSMSLAIALANNDVQVGEHLKVKKVAKKGNQVTWSVEEIVLEITN